MTPSCLVPSQDEEEEEEEEEAWEETLRMDSGGEDEGGEEDGQEEDDGQQQVGEDSAVGIPGWAGGGLPWCGTAALPCIRGACCVCCVPRCPSALRRYFG